jgi:metal-responsive CopG/Arc/MetJ family transcriptional regulator
MSCQVAARLTDATVQRIDEFIKRKAVPSRAAFVQVAVENEMRRRMAERDAEILMREGDYAEFDDLVKWSSKLPMEDLD